MVDFWRKNIQVEIAALTKSDRHSNKKKRCSAHLRHSREVPLLKRSPSLKFSLSFSVKFLSSLVGWCLVANPLKAQIVPDGSLGTETNTDNQVTEITGGTQADSNLFHSFQDFSVETGSTAFFNNGVDVTNIIGRVTGNNLSNIDGLIRANGEANLILINPNGISLGSNASLDIGGSFLGSSADSVVFEDGKVFSTDSNTQPLLTISTPVGLQLGQNSAAIQVSGEGNDNGGLAVTPGHTFALIGNGITFDGGTVTAESGRIDLGSVAEGQVSITEIETGWQLGYARVEEFGDLELSARSALLNPNLTPNATGGIQLQGSNITLERSQIVAQTLSEGIGADIVINAAESLSLSGTTQGETSSQIVNDVSAEATGEGGTIEVNTKNLNIAPRSFIGSTTFGAGNAGNIKIAATDLNITGTGFSEFQQTYQLSVFSGTLQPGDRNTGIFAGTATTGTAGNIYITANSLNLSEGAIIFNPVFEGGEGGDIDITATDINLNASALELGGGRSSQVGASLGNINLITDNLKISDGATAINLTFGDATGGNITVDADSIDLRDSPLNSIIGTGIIINTSLGAGDGGDIDIRTNTLSVVDANISSTSGARLPPDGTIISSGGAGGDIKIQAAESVEVSGIIVSRVDPELVISSGIGTSSYTDSDGGNLTIDTDKLILRDGASFTSATFGGGNGGQLIINAQDSVELTGAVAPDGTNQGGLFVTSGSSIFESEASGAAGSISVTTPRLIVENGAAIDAQSLSSGDAGSIAIKTDAVMLSDRGSLSATTLSSKGGSIQIDTETLKVDRGLINASVFDNGTGGNIVIAAEESVEISGSGFEVLQSSLFDPNQLSPEFLASLRIDQFDEGILATSGGNGNAGIIDIQTKNLDVNNGGLIATATGASGSAGSILLNASESVLVDGSFVSNNTLFNGEGGDITVDTSRLEILAGGQITASTLGSGNSGNVTVNATESMTVSGNGGTESSGLASSISVGAQPLPITTGNGGDLTINTPKLNVNDRASISIGSTGSGDAGRLQVNADSVELDSQGSISADTQSGGGGNVILDANNIIWLGESFTTATARGTGNGGNIIINADNLVALESSSLIADAFIGMGGNIQIDTQGLFVCESCQVSASSQLGLDGVVSVETLEPTNVDAIEVREPLTQLQEEVAVACPNENSSSISQLTIIGRGGLPNRPQELLNPRSIVEFKDPNAQVKRLSVAPKTLLPAPARGWHQDAQGNVLLTAQANGKATNNSAIKTADCHTP